MAIDRHEDIPAHVAVIGAGTMGAGIAQVFAAAGSRVSWIDADGDALEAGRGRIAKSLAKLVEKGRLEQDDADSALGLLEPATDLKAAQGADLAIEAVTEDEAVKKGIFAALDGLIADGGLITSNTSSIPIQRLAEATGRPGSVIGMHFMNPVPLMALVEVVEADGTDADTTARVVAIAEALGKTPVVVADAPGFVANRVLMPMINEAVRALDEGVAGADGIDTVMKLGMAHPMGPLALADLIGLDVCVAIMDVLEQGFGGAYAPSPLLRTKVEAGELGRKTGKGFYDYA